MTGKKPLVFRTAFKQDADGNYHITVTDADLHPRNQTNENTLRDKNYVSQKLAATSGPY